MGTNRSYLDAGANQFADALSVNHVALLRGGPEGVTIKFNITVRNPLPNVAMNAGTLVMNMRHVWHIITTLRTSVLMLKPLDRRTW
jgi:hypothetical protein